MTGLRRDTTDEEPSGRIVKTKSSVSGLFKHTFVYGLGDLVRKLVGFLLIPIYTRFMSPGDYGILQLSLVFVAFFQILYSFGMTTAFFRYYLDTSDPAARKKVFSTTFWSIAAVDIVLSLLMMTKSETISSFLFGEPGQTTVVFLILLVLVVETIVQVPLLLLRALDRSRTFLTFIIIQLITALAVNYLLVAVLGMGPVGAMLANLIASGFLLALTMPIVIGNIDLDFSREHFKSLLRFGLPFVPSTISMMVMNISDQYLIRYFRGLEETGLYALNYKFGMALNLFITGFRYAWVPFIFRVSGEPDSGRLYARAYEVLTVLLSAIFFLICAFLPEMYALLVDRSYFAGMGIVPLVAFSYVLFGLHTIFLAGIYLEDETSFIAKAGVAAAASNVVLNFLLIPRFGMWGAAGTTLVSFALLIVLIFRRSQKVHPIPFDITKSLGVLLVSVVMTGAVRIIEWDSMVQGILFKILLLMIYLFVLRYMGYIRIEYIREVLNWLRRDPASPSSGSRGKASPTRPSTSDSGNDDVR